jgi:hypothetical protein
MYMQSEMGRLTIAMEKNWERSGKKVFVYVQTIGGGPCCPGDGNEYRRYLYKLRALGY